MFKDKFVLAINEKLMVRVTYVTNDSRVLTRKCIPFDFGPSKRFMDKSYRYHFLDLDSPRGRHPLPLLPNRLVKLELTNTSFNPANYINWKPNWYFKRNWGKYS
ncbi:hypothetical protein BTO06_16170 [Tenacibaculum sp. SZ-18]|uniref:hypothetical protein n=1 Tax=Tenacibaculum sp. SZ-18 TaxID=754423 RepID=UPI000C2CFAF3|nr:hypothetical protein [Tenacibaculum sp. SZ-18]AUC16589.1 hypothetical protein BTO06_16170 [Tenacibaculum sp. SZ-18]